VSVGPKSWIVGMIIVGIGVIGGSLGGFERDKK